MHASGDAAFDRGDYAEAMQQYRLAVLSGDVPAATAVGALFADGLGVPQDYGQAIQWYRMAADAGDARAQLNIGKIYEFGRGVPSDFEQARQWYEKANAGGEPEGRKRLKLLAAKSATDTEKTSAAEGSTPYGQWMHDAISGCAIWTTRPHPNETVSWSGSCAGGIAVGGGTVAFTQDGKMTITLTGQMEDGKLNGHTVAMYANGDSFEGEYKDGKAEGHGIKKLATGESYEGEWKDGKQEGHGVVTYPNGTSYSGDWKGGTLAKKNSVTASSQLNGGEPEAPSPQKPSAAEKSQTPSPTPQSEQSTRPAATRSILASAVRYCSNTCIDTFDLGCPNCEMIASMEHKPYDDSSEWAAAVSCLEDEHKVNGCVVDRTRLAASRRFSNRPIPAELLPPEPQQSEKSTTSIYIVNNTTRDIWVHAVWGSGAGSESDFERKICATPDGNNCGQSLFPSSDRATLKIPPNLGIGYLIYGINLDRSIGQCDIHLSWTFAQNAEQRQWSSTRLRDVCSGQAILVKNDPP
jgi:hypothetical protein